MPGLGRRPEPWATLAHLTRNSYQGRIEGMPVKIKLPKRFYTPEQLAERWECTVEDISHLIQTKLLGTAHKGAALKGKLKIQINGFDDYEKYLMAEDEESHSDDLEFNVHGDVHSCLRLRDMLLEDGAFDQVITAAEVSRFEREHGEATDETAPPSSWPWGDYETPLLRILADAVTHFCLDGAERYPKKDCGAVVAWIMTRMEANGMQSSKSLAGVMETLISYRPYVHHRQRKQRKP